MNIKTFDKLSVKDKTKSPAYIFMKEFVLNYLENNIKRLLRKYVQLDKRIIIEIKNDEDGSLEWVLGEILDHNEFLELGYVVIDEWIDNESIHTTIYKIEDKYIGVYFTNYIDDEIFTFVEPIEKTIIVKSYEPIEDK